MMDYKKIFKNAETRKKILNMLSFIPDSLMLRIQYYIKQGHHLNLSNPVLFTEKLQWYKLNYKDPEMIKCVDKYDVREYVKDKGLAGILNECYGIYDSPAEINYEELPSSFVVKDTLGGGSRDVVVIQNKNNLDQQELYYQMERWVNEPYDKKGLGREWPYSSGKKHRIIIEKYLESNPEEGGLIDYKFFCFNGVPKFLYVIADRKIGQNAGIGIYTADFERLPYSRADERPLEREIAKPENYDQMRKIAAKLSGNFPFVRVDLYNIKGQIVFGETTFFPGSGYMRFSPPDFDYVLGQAFILPEKRK